MTAILYPGRRNVVLFEDVCIYAVPYMDLKLMWETRCRIIELAARIIPIGETSSSLVF